MITSFVPSPAKMSGPRVVCASPLRVGEVDRRAIGNAIHARREREYRAMREREAAELREWRAEMAEFVRMMEAEERKGK